ncbi:hypothetical protein M3Y95_01157400 [Aphelenchoides besseyi]|nr:hypothetical protein M3Y95_01157400 [Aphelenchoides besseyi]
MAPEIVESGSINKHLSSWNADNDRIRLRIISLRTEMTDEEMGRDRGDARERTSNPRFEMTDAEREIQRTKDAIVNVEGRSYYAQVAEVLRRNDDNMEAKLKEIETIHPELLEHRRTQRNENEAIVSVDQLMDFLCPFLATDNTANTPVLDINKFVNKITMKFQKEYLTPFHRRSNTLMEFNAATLQARLIDTALEDQRRLTNCDIPKVEAETVIRKMVLSIERTLSAAIKAWKRVYLLAKQITANLNKALICGADKDQMEIEFHTVCGPRYHVVGPQSPLYDTAHRIVDQYPLIHKSFMEKLTQTGSFGWIKRIHMETEQVHWVQNEEVDDLCDSNSDDDSNAIEEIFGTDDNTSKLKD